MFDPGNEGEVWIIEDGIRHDADWEIAAGMIYVHSNGRTSTPTQVNGLNPDWLARDILRGMIREARR